MTIEELINIGADIMKHEYFMVAQHDILESSIINHFNDSIPPISSKSITDFVFKGIPVDLKVSGFPDTWAKRARQNKCLTDDEKRRLIVEMYSGADTERMRKQADGSVNNWGLDRMYILIREQDKWFTDPQSIIDHALSELEKIKSPFSVMVNGFQIEAFCIDI